MSTFKRARKKVWVQSAIQGGLVIRTVMYWFFCLCTILLFVAVGTLFSGQLNSAGNLFAGVWRQYWPAVLACVLLLPLVAIDVIRFSHRIVGPLIRLENEMKRMADGERVQAVHFRTRDHWHSLAEQFNRIVELQQQSPDQEPQKSAPESRREYEAVV